MDGLQIVGSAPTPKLTKEQLVDAIAVQDAIAATAHAQSAALKAALLALVGTSKQSVNGITHRATIVESHVQWKLNTALVTEEMGEAWVIKHSKQCLRKAYVLITGRKLI